MVDRIRSSSNDLDVNMSAVTVRLQKKIFIHSENGMTSMREETQTIDMIEANSDNVEKEA